MPRIVILPSSSPPATVHHRFATPARQHGTFIPDSDESIESLPSLKKVLNLPSDRRYKSGSKAQAAPQNAVLGFQTTSNLVRHNWLDLHPEPGDGQDPPVKVSTKKSKAKPEGISKNTRADGDIVADNVKPKRARKKPAKVEGSNVQQGAAKEAKDPNSSAKRPRKRKSDEMARSIQEQDVVDTTSADGLPKSLQKQRKKRKTDADKEAVGKKKVERVRKKTDKSSSHFDVPKVAKAARHDSTLGEDAQTVEVSIAIKRKTNWTPERKRSNKMQDLEPISPEELAIYDVPSSPPRAGIFPRPYVSPQVVAPPAVFAELRKTFGYDDYSPTTSVSPIRDRAGPVSLGQRKKIDPIETPYSVVEQPAQEVPETPHLIALLPELIINASNVLGKTKVVHAKPFTTITARALAKYAPVALDEVVTNRVSPHSAPVFDSNNPASHPVAIIASTKKSKKAAKDGAKPRAARKPRKKADWPVKEDAPKKSVKVAAKSSKTRPVAPADPKLTSPTEHARRLQRQDMLFGTSSQLALDEPAAFVTSLRQALHESELDAIRIQKHKSYAIARGAASVIRRSESKLWAAAARMDTDPVILDNVEMSALAGEEMVSHATVNASKAPDMEDSWNDIDQIYPLVMDEERFRAPIPTNGIFLSPTRSSSPLPTSHQAPLTAPVLRNQVHSRPSTSPQRTALRTMSTNTGPPHKRVADAVQEPIKPPPLLVSRESEVDGIPKKARGRPGKEINHFLRDPEPKKPRGRPPKVKAIEEVAKVRELILKNDIPKITPKKPAAQSDACEGFKDIDEIEDSEPDRTPTPPKRPRGRPPGSSHLTLTAPPETSEMIKRANTLILNDAHPRWPGVRDKLYPEITATIKSAPRSLDIRKPSWYEKMVMFDPIVLEDLTGWLNEKGLHVEGKDANPVELSAWMVQGWCERNSICCLLKEGSRGGVRVKY